MNKKSFLKQNRRGQSAWPLVTTMIGCILFATAVAQGAPTIAENGGALSATSTNQGPTYLGDIRPILMGHCARCHNEQSRFVYDWLDYKTAYADRWELKRRIWNSWNGTYYKEAMPVANSPEAELISEDDRLLIVKWVDNGAPRGVEPPPGAALSKADQIEHGRRLFGSICAACHQPTGLGRPNVFPPLAGSDFLNADKGRAIQTVIFGRHGVVVVNGQTFNNTMPSLPLTDGDIANVLTYVYNSFGNSGLVVMPNEVKAIRAQPPVAATPPAASATPAPASPFE